MEFEGKNGRTEKLWKIQNKAVDAARKITIMKGEPGSKERIEAYRAQAEAGLPLFEDQDDEN